MSATTYSGNAILNAYLRGITLTLPSGLWVSLHDADPGNTGANEIVIGDWPAYVRKSALGGGAIAGAFAAASGKATLSAQQMLWPAYDGAGTIVISHWTIWDAVTTGNALFSGALRADPSDPDSTLAPKTLGVGDEIILYAAALGIKVT